LTRPIPPQHRKKYRSKHRVDGTFKKPRRGKYNAKGRHVEGQWCASEAEATRYEQLIELQQAGDIIELKCQVAFPIQVKGIHIANYLADFRYCKVKNGKRTILIEDVKGMLTPEYKLKKKLVEALHQIKILEIAGRKVKGNTKHNGTRGMTGDEIVQL